MRSRHIPLPATMMRTAAGAVIAGRAHTARAMLHTRSLLSASATAATAVHSSVSATATPAVARVRSPAAPLRLAVLGAGISGLTLAHQLQRAFRQQGRAGVEIHMFESSSRSGGWVHTTRPDGFLLEAGPRSLMYRRGVPESATTLELLGQLGLGSQVLLADKAAAKRFLWNTKSIDSADGQLVAFPTSLGSFWSWKYRNASLRGMLKEWRTPKLQAETEEQSDESVHQFMSRRFGGVLAEELVDPLIAGIYAGDPRALSMQSCLGRLSRMERSGGGILRASFGKKEQENEQSMEQSVVDSDSISAQGHLWKESVINHPGGIYTLQGGLSTLTHALRQRLTSDAQDPYSAYLRQRGARDAPDAAFHMHANSPVHGLHISETNKPVLHVTNAAGEKQQLQFDHCFSTLPTFALHSLLGHELSSLPLPSEHRSDLLSLLSREATPFASVWVVHVVFAGQVLPESQRAFGVLVPSAHNTPGQELLGISFDSCIFPQLNTRGGPDGETRITVMLGGARHPWIVDESEEQVQTRALDALKRMVGIDTKVTRPLLVSATLNRDAIPQFLVGHAARQHRAHQLLQHLAYPPPSFSLPVVRDLPPLTVPLHESAVRAQQQQQQTEALRPLSLLGTNYGVALNDCMHHATYTAKIFAERCEHPAQV